MNIYRLRLVSQRNRVHTNNRSQINLSGGLLASKQAEQMTSGCRVPGGNHCRY